MTTNPRLGRSASAQFPDDTVALHAFAVFNNVESFADEPVNSAAELESAWSDS